MLVSDRYAITQAKKKATEERANASALVGFVRLYSQLRHTVKDTFEMRRSLNATTGMCLR